MNQFARDARRTGALLVLLTGTVAVAALVLTMAATAQGGCGICGKNLIKNPGAEAGMGAAAVGAAGRVPSWTNEAGQFGAAAYRWGAWFSPTSKGPPNRGKNYFFGGTTTEAHAVPASIGKQVIKLPRAAVGRKATLSGWIGNYTEAYRPQVRAQFLDAAGAVLSTVRIGPTVTLGGTDMVLRSRTGTVPAKTTQVAVVVIIGTGTGMGKLAGVDNLSLVLS